MILVAYQRTMAGAAQRAAQRGRVLVAELPAPKCQPALYVAPVPLERVVIQMPPSPYYQRRRIMDLMARMHGVNYAAVIGRHRSARISHARHAAICAVKEWETICGRDMSTTLLGRLFGKRDHSTVISAYRVRGYIRPLDRPQSTGDRK